MYNPDDPNEKTEQRPNSCQPVATVMSEKQKLKFYILDGGMAGCYGLRVTPEKRLEVADLNKVNRLDPHIKSIVRELYQELRK